MRLRGADLAAAFALFRRDWLIYLSYRARVPTQIASGVVSLIMFHFISQLVRVSPFRTPAEYFAFVVVGLVVMEILASTLIVVPTAVRQELVAGTFERLVLSPFGAVPAIVSMLLFPITWSVMIGGVMIAIGGLVFDMPIAWATAPLSIPVVALGALSFVPFALLMTAAVLLFKQAASGAVFVVAGISLIGGFFFPVSLLPGWIQWASEVQPYSPTLELLRHLLIGAPSNGSPSTTLVKLGLFVIVLFPPSLWALWRSVLLAQRRGTIIEY